MFKLIAVIVALTSPPQVIWSGVNKTDFADKAACETQMPIERAQFEKMIADQNIKAQVALECVDKAALDAALAKSHRDNSI